MHIWRRQLRCNSDEAILENIETSRRDPLLHNLLGPPIELRYHREFANVLLQKKKTAPKNLKGARRGEPCGCLVLLLCTPVTTVQETTRYKLTAEASLIGQRPYPIAEKIVKLRAAQHEDTIWLRSEDRRRHFAHAAAACWR
ncbi:hypothetical protein OH76DRAFT_13018 [Lentinus brumalis]|uniref:Uncharacterized protein n=1 Tax=Lentinus brumalis TaxID=2498619 RepID=A0A371DX06_9APHY|nr:hypothetical protein OH76DRAFT_13018 [Polyporus brumalis]